MPITYVLKVNVPGDQVASHKEMLEKRLAALRPKRLNKLHVQTVVYQTLNQNQVHQFLHSDYSATCFSIIEQPAMNYMPGDYKILTGKTKKAKHYLSAWPLTNPIFFLLNHLFFRRCRLGDCSAYNFQSRNHNRAQAPAD